MEGLGIRAASEWLLGRIMERIADTRSRTVLERDVILINWSRDVLAAVCERDDLDLSWYKTFTGVEWLDLGPDEPPAETLEKLETILSPQ